MPSTADATHEAPPRVLVIVPTYDEHENLEPVAARVLAAAPSADVLVVDDGSPDGTDDLADALTGGDERAAELHRSQKAGLGAAYVAGFARGLSQGHDVLVEMDADGSHDPGQLPRLLATLGGPDGGDLHTRLALGIALHDATGGYRAYRRAVLEGIDLTTVASQGHCLRVSVWGVERCWAQAQALLGASRSNRRAVTSDATSP